MLPNLGGALALICSIARAGLFGASGFGHSPLLYAVVPQESQSLEIHRPVQREMAGGEVHSYLIKLEAGQYARIHLEQHEIDIAATLLDPDGQKIAEVNTPDETQGTERISLVADRSSAYTLQVRSVQKDALAGRYEAVIAVIRPATQNDRKYVEAERAFAEGEGLRQEGKAETLAKSHEHYQHALSLWRGLGEPEREADTLVRIARVYKDMGENPKAVTLLEQALSIQRAAGDRRGEARTLHDLGSIYDDLGEKGKALDFLNQSALLFRGLGFRQNEAISLTNIGGVYHDMGEPEKALQHYSVALPIYRGLRDRRGEAFALNNIAVTYSALWERHKALDYFVQVLALTREIGYRRGEAIALSAIGSNYAALGENERALTHYEQSLPIRREVGDRRGEGYVLGFIGTIHARLGEHGQAIDYHQKALPLLRAAGDRRVEAIALRRIGVAYDALGEKRKALDSFAQALPLHRAVSDPTGEASTLKSLGVTLASLGEAQKALESLSEALALQRRTSDRTGQAQTLAGIARVERDRGNLEEARSRIEAALEVIETLRTQVGDPDLRASYLASVRMSYEFYAELLMRLHRAEPSKGYDVLAFQASQRMRARSLLELLQEAGANVREGVDPELAQRERSLQRLLSAKLERQVRLSSGKPDEAASAALAREIEQITTEYDALKARIRTTSPRYAALTQPQPLTLSEIQRELDTDSLLLEYSLGEDRSFLWAVTSGSLTSYELPRRSELESATRAVHDLLTARNRRPKGESVEAQRARVARTDAEFAKAASELSRTLLSPVAGLMEGKRLLIVTDGALQYLPLAALPIPAGAGEGVPLVVEHELVSLPSASILSALRRDRANRRPVPGTLAVLADPVFEEDDERVVGSAAARKTRPSPTVGRSSGVTDAERDLLRSAADMGVADEGGLQIPRLPFTRLEAQAILGLAPRHSRKLALDFDASRATATSPELSRYRFVHFATHGFLNSLHPELSGIVLSLVDRKGRAVPGFLPAAEVFNLKLPVEMVVLSGCRTALGKEIRGEGLVGLTQGFFYAGAARVVASLWKVEDAATAELMTRFYRGILGKERLRPSAALRAAQVSMWKEKRWTAPYYWSAFLMQGDPR